MQTQLVTRQLNNDGSGVIWITTAMKTSVIPAKAGIQSVGNAFQMTYRLDSRLRGNDDTGEAPCPGNDRTTNSDLSVF
jgi:hypothetical protein